MEMREFADGLEFGHQQKKRHKESTRFCFGFWGGFLLLFLVFFLFVFLFFVFSRATPAAYGGSQARGLIGAIAASLCQSHSNVGSELGLRPTPQLTVMPDP